MQTINQKMSGYARSGKARKIKKVLATMTLVFLFALSCNLALAQWAGAPAGTGLPQGGIENILSNFLSWALGIFGILAVLAFIISGIMYLTSAGNQTRTESAKKAMYWSIIGIVVGLSGWIILNEIINLLR